IEGEGFTNARRVEFGGVSASFSVVSDTEISATAPAHSAGAVDVTVERGDVSATLVDGYNFEEALEVYGLTPVRGSVAGNTYVEIRGRGFIGPVDVTFGGDAAASVQVLDAQTLAVRTPPHASGAVDVAVSRGSDSVTAPEQYTYFNPGSRFGGSWGGPIQGAVNVTVYAQGGSPIAGAYVQLSTNPQTTYTGETDQNGMVTLSGPDVYGEQTVTATAAEYSSATVQDVNAENITIFLSPPPSQGPPPPGPPTATFEGELTGLNKIKEPGPTEIQVAYVTTTKTNPWSRNPAPGDGATVFNDGPYTINSRIGDLALVAVGGLYDNATDEFTPLALGVERYLFASEGQTYTVDIDLNIPLDTTMNYKVDAPPLEPSGPTIHRVIPFLDFGFEGVWQMQNFGETTNDVVDIPYQADLTGVLSDVEYFAMGGAYTNGNAPPLSIAFNYGISDASSLVTMPKSPTIAEVISPADGDIPTNGLVQFDADASAAPDFYYVRVMTFQQATVYEAFLPGTATSFRFPDFPDFSHLPEEERPVPYPGGTYQLMIIGVNQQGTSIDDWSYSDLSLDSWESYSLWQQLISF
ncbi:MAG: IPT/TIG domain-containing protein, partial [Myxococcota bacterium]